MTADPSHDAIVIGAGFAGMRAARDLREAGRSVVVLEGRDRLGGRTWAAPFPGYDRRVELGGAWVAPKLHPFVAAEMSRYGLRLNQAADSNAPRWLWRSENRVSRSFPLQGDELYELERALYRIIDATRRIDPNVPRDMQDLADLDVSIADWLHALELSPRTHEFLATWGALGSGAQPEDWSALSALSLMAAANNSAYAWYGAVTETLVGGPGAVLDAMLADSEPEVRLQTTVRRIEQRADDVVITATDGTTFTAAVAVVALPLNLWQTVDFSPPLTESKSAMARRGHPNRIGKVWALVHGAPEDTTCFGLGSDLSFLSPEYEVDGAALMVGFRTPPSSLEVTDSTAVERAVHQFLPDAEVLATAAHDWNSDPFSRGGWPAYPPDTLSRVASELQKPEGRLSFATADIATRWIGWLDGALESGARAAQQALSRLEGRPVEVGG